MALHRGAVCDNFAALQFNFRAVVNVLATKRPERPRNRADKRDSAPYIAVNNAIELIESGPHGARFFVASAAFRNLLWRLSLPHPLEEKVAAIIAPLVAREGFELVRVRIMGRKAFTVQVMAERADKTMSADDCAALSRALSAALDEMDPMPGAYTLEVSSPGIDRPLTRLKDFEDWRGYEARLELDRMIEGRKRFEGVLAGIDGDNVCLDIKGEDETALIPFKWIVGARLVLTNDLIRESLKAAKAAKKETENEMHSGDNQ